MGEIVPKTVAKIHRNVLCRTTAGGNVELCDMCCIGREQRMKQEAADLCNRTTRSVQSKAVCWSSDDLVISHLFLRWWHQRGRFIQRPFKAHDKCTDSGHAEQEQ